MEITFNVNLSSPVIEKKQRLPRCNQCLRENKERTHYSLFSSIPYREESQPYSVIVFLYVQVPPPLLLYTQVTPRESL